MTEQSNTMKPVLLSARNLSIGYKTKSIENILLENLELTLHSGELVCFMGPNGIGKSTLIRTLAGLQKEIKGTVATHAVSKISASVNPTRISVVLTDKVTAVNMTVKELVAYGRYPYLDWSIRLSKEDQQAIEQAIEVTHISSIANKKLYELSDGQMQMALIARALAQDTPLLLLDEPTAHLDLNNRVEIMNLLRKLTRTAGKGILLATHELDLALQTADLIWLAGNNKNILTGIPEDLVLDGSFDEIFKLKGFDLKTGKVFHEPWRGVSINLIGDGHGYLWTKNALERCGFVVSKEGRLITVEQRDGELFWTFNSKFFLTLQDLIAEL